MKDKFTTIWENRVTAGILEGFVLGLMLCDFYGGVFHLLGPFEEVAVVAYADDLALIVTTCDKYCVENKANGALNRVEQWMTAHRSQLVSSLWEECTFL